jgi:Ca-activated chloride channel family protein
MLRFEWPWALLLLLGLPLLARWKGARSPAVLFNRVAPGMPQSRRQRWLRLPAHLRFAALALLILAMSGPRLRARHIREISQTIGVQMVVDCSGSMLARDMEDKGGKRARIDVVRDVSRAFAFGGWGFGGRINDMLGLVAFAEEAVTLCPLTLAHETLWPAIEGIRVGSAADGTAIGDAVAVAAARFRTAEIAAQQVFKSKAIILITDGENNSGKRSPQEAARLAQQWGVRIYAIAIRPGEFSVQRTGQKAGQSAGQNGGAMETLEAMAAATGGIARTAGNGAGLRDIYAEIDGLERAEHAADYWSGGRELIYLLLAGALLLVAAEGALAQTWLRRLP